MRHPCYPAVRLVQKGFGWYFHLKSKLRTCLFNQVYRHKGERRRVGIQKLGGSHGKRESDERKRVEVAERERRRTRMRVRMREGRIRESEEDRGE